MSIDYAAPGPLTTLTDAPALASVAADPVAVCAPVHGLIVQPTDPGAPPDRLDEKQLRPASAIVARLLDLDPAPLSSVRPPAARVVGTCRHYAVLSCALLRYRGIPARARCGFATYFQPGRGLDHWITEYHDGSRWVRIDTEAMGLTVLSHPDDLRPGEFLTGGEAWAAHRRGELDASTFGVFGTENWGPAEISGNAVRDLAALNKVEMLPWDEWGRMTDAYDGKTGPDYDALIDRVAEACASEDVAGLYRHDDLRVPGALIG
ncbi:transglutaminase-like domain-containing protein [Cryptosporangium phraense]|uniref:Transglutaminase n=1 Tax=Cryptosporangium phraense TaxID=2593070 RepID=A0A545AXR3_9ACTN|nr:transglutaminase-like domain-containing protein [Cryptosporangium phraense]TQS46122.1 transglutaminase [Cryptosporangium phraense]